MAYDKWILACGVVGSSLTAWACGGDETAPGAPPPAEEPPPGTFIEADPQRDGDAAAGYDALVNEAYVACGVPYSIYSLAFGVAPPEMRLDGREGKNAEMPYGQTYFVT